MEASNRSAVSIQQAIYVAEKQGSDVLSATPFPAMPRWGRRAGCIVYLKDERRGEFRVTTHYEGDGEFDQGFYYIDGDLAQSTYLERVKRTWIDLHLHAELEAERS